MRVALAIKRVADFCAAALGLVLLSPILVLVGLIIRLESPGPALFKQERLGQAGEPFTFLKFRTMVDGNDPSIHQEYVRELITQGSESLKGDTGSFKIENDPRVTRFGRILRRTSVDELPQLINVLIGDMSLVGPRPPLRYEVKLYSPRALRRLECRPGITGLWQVSGRCETTFDEMVALDIEYAERWSLGLDLKILVRTIPVVFGRKGAW
ncbi:MAG: UDP-phosphate galactose phosphotransferase [Actinobacteria bacterium HGW-Actinobacteria-7]|nr:MAG: UDP-phosphate galactose phosphotransferase [Actinobacteria bacterium HGW-Actinobacteria-7]